ncbi:hypothetical protein [Photobacterium satsumensis]|uniref:hypothetical protein n=1 Tax=Photobacterium satsumensis TaxID=2910239 RepID=UPI003D0A6901
MFNQLFPMIIVFGGSCAYLLLWNESLKRRKLLQIEVLNILNDDSYSQLLKRKVTRRFLNSGKHFYITQLLYHTFIGYLKVKIFGSNKKRKSIPQLNETENKIDSDIFAKCTIVNLILSPVQVVLAMLIAFTLMQLHKLCGRKVDEGKYSIFTAIKNQIDSHI